MKNLFQNRIGVLLLILFSLPIFLHVYNPAMKLGGFGLLLGMIGYYISPILILLSFIYLFKQSGKGAS